MRWNNEYPLSQIRLVSYIPIRLRLETVPEFHCDFCKDMQLFVIRLKLQNIADEHCLIMHSSPFIFTLISNLFILSWEVPNASLYMYPGQTPSTTLFSLSMLITPIQTPSAFDNPSCSHFYTKTAATSNATSTTPKPTLLLSAPLAGSPQHVRPYVTLFHFAATSNTLPFPIL